MKNDNDLANVNLEASKVIQGKNNFLFLTNDSNNIIPQITGKMQLSSEQLLRWRLLLEMRYLWLQKKNIEYFYFVVPNKSCVYSKFLPDNIKVSENRCIFQLHNYLTQSSFFRLIYPVNELRDANNENETYRKGDTHWNYFGSYVGYMALMSEIKKTSLHTLNIVPKGEVEFYETISLKEGEFDLGNKIGRRQDILTRSKMRNTSSSCIFDNKVKGSGRLYTYENTNKNLSSAMFFGDSFAHFMMPYLAESFSKLTFIHQPNLDYELIEQERPDIVISQQVERFIIKMPNDLSGKSQKQIAWSKKNKDEIWVYNNKSDKTSDREKELLSRLKQEPNNPQLYFTFGKFLEKQNLLDDALNNYDKALSLGLETFTLYHSKGMVFKKKGDYASAVDLFSHAINLNPNFFWSHWFLGVCLEKSGKIESALQSYTLANEIDPNHNGCNQRLKDLNDLLSSEN